MFGQKLASPLKPRSLFEGPLRWFDSMAGHVFVVLALGTCSAAILSLVITENARRQDFERVRLTHVVASAVDVAARLNRSPEEMKRMLADGRVLGALLAPNATPIVHPSPQLVSLLRPDMPHVRDIEAGQASEEACYHRADWDRRAAGSIVLPLECWLVRYSDGGGLHTLAIDLPHFKPPPIFDPLYLGLIVLASAGLSALIASWVSAPMQRLEAGAQAFSLSLDPEPLSERGPSDVRTAIAAFNVMQQRVRDSLRERTQVLAAISHDLQTPLTRLRLRLEKVEDLELRERLIADLTATQTLVREGLDLARSSESGEDWSLVDIDSLLASLAEDAGEFGADVRFSEGCGASVKVKPNALIRCLSNLIDNALKYAGGADLSCVFDEERYIIRVSDHGPGAPPEILETWFEPFVRGDESRSRETGGTGIGLTIARAQAGTFGAEVTLSNRPSGGLNAVVKLPRWSP